MKVGSVVVCDEMVLGNFPNQMQQESSKLILFLLSNILNLWKIVANALLLRVNVSILDLH